MENSSLQKSDNLEVINPICYYEPSKTRKWELSYGGRDKIYLNDKERDSFLKSIYAGAETVQVGDLTLSKFFRYLIPTKRDIGIIQLDKAYDEKISEEQRLKNRETIKSLKEQHGLIHQDKKSINQ